MPPTLGQRLKHAREKRQLSLQDIAHKTRIPVARLVDMEEDNLTHFGGFTYARAFLKDYAELLQVDATEVLERLHPPPLGGVRDYRYLVESYGPWVPERRTPAPSHAPMRDSMPSPRFWGVVVVTVLGMLMLGGVLIAGGFLKNEDSQGTAAKPAPPEAPVAVQPEELGIIPPKAVPVEEPPEPVKPAIIPPKAQPVEAPKPPKAKAVR